jgi:nucleotide-binding universal stress UspA family protein
MRDTVEGHVIAGILEEARTMPADLIVMGTHGRTGFTRMLLGSVTERVLRQAPCPVLTVPRKVKPTDAPPVQRILCPIDFSESSLRALRHAATVAREAEAELVVLHVIELLPEATVYGHGIVDIGAYDDKFRETARARMAAAIEDSVPESKTVTEVIAAGRPYKEILREADERRADLIVIGIQGRGSADLMLFGSTTQQVVRQATVPVLTLRAR